jgi:hypothetical protein
VLSWLCASGLAAGPKSRQNGRPAGSGENAESNSAAHLIAPALWCAEFGCPRKMKADRFLDRTSALPASLSPPPAAERRGLQNRMPSLLFRMSIFHPKSLTRISQRTFIQVFHQLPVRYSRAAGEGSAELCVYRSKNKKCNSRFAINVLDRAHEGLPGTWNSLQ